MSVVLADDHPSVRAGVRAFFEATERITVVGEAADGAAAVALVRELQPAVLLLDMELPEIDGIGVAKRLQTEGTPTRVLAYSAYDDKAYVARMVQLGASGYVTKEKPLPLVAEAVEAVARGEGRWFVSMVRPELDVPLSDREVDVLRLMAKGLDNKAISERLSISAHTVRNHVASVYDKLEVHSWREAIAWAWERGLVGNP